ncbi:hypothetical protein KL923_004513 [Ogataea haglerorum]|nr:hypothetical protein KL923_004513 [Ogataea haglerorum]
MLDHTNTQFGRRELKRWVGRPLTDREEVAKRADSVESIIENYQSVAIESTVKLLRNCPDLEAALSRIHYGRSKRKDTYMFLKKMNEILQFYGDLPDTHVQINPFLREIFQDLKTAATSTLRGFRDLLDMVHSPAAIDDTSPEHVTSYFNTKFFEYHLIQQHLENISHVEQQLEAELKDIRKTVGRPGMGYVTNNKEPYLVEVRNTQVASLPKDWVKINGTKSVSRFRTPSGAALPDHRPEYGRKVVVHPPDRTDRGNGADRLLHTCGSRLETERFRLGLHANGRTRRYYQGRVHVPGGAEGMQHHSERVRTAVAGSTGRSWPWNEHNGRLRDSALHSAVPRYR